MIIMVRIIIHVLPEKQQEVLQTLLSLIEPSRKEQGCLSYGVFRNIEDEHILNVISEWESSRHLALYKSSDRFRVVLGTKSLLQEPLKVQILTAQTNSR